MPNIKSAIKRVKVTRVKTLKNSMRKSALKTTVKKAVEAISSSNIENANTSFKQAVKAIDKAVAKGILHKNTAARKKSTLAKSLNVAAK